MLLCDDPLVVLVTPAFAAQAQETATEPARTLEEIVVTAQNREQIRMGFPQSVTVLDGRVLQRQQVDKFKEYLC